MLNIGSHLSVAKGFTAMGKQALKMDANTFQFFTRNPRGGKAKDIDQKDIEGLIKIMEENSFAPILAHAPYTLNPAAEKEETKRFAFEAMSDDLRRMELLPNNYYNFHPGSHVGQGVEKGIELISGLLNRVLFEGMNTTVLLETMAGKGTEVGRSFQEIAEIIKRTELEKYLGVTLDTCHVFDAGYDIVNSLDEVLGEFDKIIGIKRLKAVHLNDSMNTLGCHKDRHQCIGKGGIGLEALTAVINHPLLRDLPFYLETPLDENGHAEEIKLLRSLYKE